MGHPFQPDPGGLVVAGQVAGAGQSAWWHPVTFGCSQPENAAANGQDATR